MRSVTVVGGRLGDDMEQLGQGCGPRHHWRVSAGKLQWLDSQDARCPFRRPSCRGAIVRARDVEAADVRLLVQLRDVRAEGLALWPPPCSQLPGNLGRTVVIVAIH